MDVPVWACLGYEAAAEAPGLLERLGLGRLTVFPYKCSDLYCLQQSSFTDLKGHSEALGSTGTFPTLPNSVSTCVP